MPAFERIELPGRTDVTVAPGDPSVTVRGDDNLIAEVVTDVEGDTLTVGERRPAGPRAELEVESLKAAATRR